MIHAGHLTVRVPRYGETLGKALGSALQEWTARKLSRGGGEAIFRDLLCVSEFQGPIEGPFSSGGADPSFPVGLWPALIFIKSKGEDVYLKLPINHPSERY